MTSTTLDQSIAHSAQRIEEIQNFSNGLIGALDAGQSKNNAQFGAKVQMPELEAKVTELSQALKAAQEQVKQVTNDPNNTTEQVATAITRLSEITAQHQQAVAALGASRKSGSGIGQVDDGAYSKELQRQKQLEEERTKLLKQQQEQLKWRDKLNNDAAKTTNSAAQAQQDASRKMESAVQSFDNTVNNVEKKNLSSLAIENPMMSFYTGRRHADEQSTNTGQIKQPQLNQRTGLEGLPNLGVLYLASQDGKTMVEVLTKPENMKIIQQIAVRGINESVRDGAMANT